MILITVGFWPDIPFAPDPPHGPFIMALAEDGVDEYYEYGFGEAFAADLYNAREAVRRLVVLLDEEKAK